jgi:trehalose-6-phosphate synthase
MENSPLNMNKENSNNSLDYFLNISVEDMEKYETLNRQLNDIINNINTKFDFINFTKEKIKPIKQVINKNI